MAKPTILMVDDDPEVLRAVERDLRQRLIVSQHRGEIQVVSAAVFLREPLTRVKAVALGLAVLGLALTVGLAGGQLAGVLFAISGAVIHSIYEPGKPFSRAFVKPGIDHRS